MFRTRILQTSPATTIIARGRRPSYISVVLQAGRVPNKQPLTPSFRSLYRSYSSVHTVFPHTPPSKGRSIFRRVLGFSVIAIVSFALGIASNPNVKKMRDTVRSIPSDEETLSSFTPNDDVAQEIDDFINSHPLTKSLRADSKFTESRPHLKYPPELRPHNLTAGTLLGPNKIVVPPYSWNEDGGKSFISIFYLGSDLCGHPGIIHGGLLATLLDEGLARCCFPALPNKIGVTANLNIDYRQPALAGSFYVLRAETTKVEGRKAFVKGWIEPLVEDGEKRPVVVEANALFIEPKNAAMMPRIR